jgi:hypothetical protein
MKVRGFVALVVVCLVLTSCAKGPSLHPADVARASFSREHYCPLDRVHTEAFLDLPPAPPAIAADPERRAMWNDAHRGRVAAVVGGDGATPVMVRASGCNEASLYECHLEGGMVPARRRSRYEHILTTCTEHF